MILKRSYSGYNKYINKSHHLQCKKNKVIFYHSISTKYIQMTYISHPEWSLGTPL